VLTHLTLPNVAANLAAQQLPAGATRQGARYFAGEHLCLCGVSLWCGVHRLLVVQHARHAHDGCGRHAAHRQLGCRGSAAMQHRPGRLLRPHPHSRDDLQHRLAGPTAAVHKAGGCVAVVLRCALR
jgi:hypothetical protein